MNTITAEFRQNSKWVTAPALYQWDYGQVLILDGLELPASYEVHFSNKPEGGQAEVRIGTDEGVVIPDLLLETGEPVYAFVFLHSDSNDGETVYLVRIPVKKRPKPFYGTPTASQQSVIAEVIAALNAGTERALAAAAAAEDSATASGSFSESAEQYAAIAGESESAASGYAAAAAEYCNEAFGHAEAAGIRAANADQSALNASAAAAAALASEQAAATSATNASSSATAAAAARSGIETTISSALANAKASGDFKGDKGDKGAVFTPSVSSTGVLSWTNNDGLVNPAPVDLVTTVCNVLSLAEEASF